MTIRKKYPQVLIILVLLCLALSVVLSLGYLKIKNFADSRLAIKQETLFTLPSGSGRVAFEALLLQQQVIAPSSLFSCLLHIEPELAKFKAGTYRLMPEMTVRDMLNLLASGKEAQFFILFIEGSTFKDWLNKLQGADYVKQQLIGKNNADIASLLALESNAPLEGWFYPDTYSYTAGTTDISLLKRAHEKMAKVVAEIWQGRDELLPYKTPNDLVVMASIIEKESAIKDERHIVASVFVNRLRLGMRLQADPTVIYGMGKNYKGKLTRKDLLTTTLYNTYTNRGLPQTAIAMPSLVSLNATAHPAKTQYLYFVADSQGGHKFSADLAQHNDAVRIYRQGLKDKNAQ